MLTVLAFEDYSGKIEVTCFAEIGELHRELLKVENILVIECEISFDDFSGGLRAVAKTLHDLQHYQAIQAKLLKLTIQESQSTPSHLLKLREILHQSPGNCPIELLYEREDGKVHFHFGKEWSVLPNPILLEALDDFTPEVIF